ncbi:MAG: MarR family winged helix-turn-helix transcriptional regulator [Lachnospiraceae bacterium]
MNAYDTVNDVLVNLFNEIWKLEEKAIITDEYKDITVNDMHIIEAIGLGDGNNMSTIARKLDITVGSLTISMNGLVRKKYAVRERSEADRRVVNIRLTERGEGAYRHHAQFHERMAKDALEVLSEDETVILTRMLQKLSDFFRRYEI